MMVNVLMVIVLMVNVLMVNVLKENVLMVNVLMVNVLISEWSPPVSKSAVSFFYFVLRFILNKFFNALLSTFIIFFDILWYSLISLISLIEVFDQKKRWSEKSKTLTSESKKTKNIIKEKRFFWISKKSYLLWWWEGVVKISTFIITWFMDDPLFTTICE